MLTNRWPRGYPCGGTPLSFGLGHSFFTTAFADGRIALPMVIEAIDKIFTEQRKGTLAHGRFIGLVDIGGAIHGEIRFYVPLPRRCIAGCRGLEYLGRGLEVSASRSLDPGSCME